MVIIIFPMFPDEATFELKLCKRMCSKWLKFCIFCHDKVGLEQPRMH